MDSNDATVRTIGTYNILLPFYAVKWSDPEGLYPTGGDNWAHRKDSLYQFFTESWLDVFLLQEVGPNEVKDLYIGEIAKHYVQIYSPHPSRRDGVAIWFKRSKFSLLYSFTLNHVNGHVSVFAKLQDKELPSAPSLVVGSAHVAWGADGDGQMQQLHAFLKDYHLPNSITMIGGDFNRGFDNVVDFIHSGFTAGGDNTKPTRHQAKLDWIFYKRQSTTLVTEIEHRWTARAMQLSTQATSFSSKALSDHAMHAIALKF